jgi:hypothetical protein
MIQQKDEQIIFWRKRWAQKKIIPRKKEVLLVAVMARLR